jgi:alkylglycerol monooxygenase
VANVNPILFALPIFGLAMALELWVSARRGIKTYAFADSLTSLNAGILNQVMDVLLKAASLIPYAWVLNNFSLFSWSLDNPLHWVLALLLYDFCYYWLHRAGHEINLLWAVHSVHHSSEHYNLSTALRQPAFAVLFNWPFFLVLAVLGVPVEMMVAVGLIDLLYQYWVHTELVGRLGWFDRVFVSPSNHRVHHGQNDYCLDKNYGGILIIWDRLFGTFAPEREREKITYGIKTQLKSMSQLAVHTSHFSKMLKDVVRARGLKAKLQAVFAPPGGGQPFHFFDASRFELYTPGVTPVGLRLACSIFVLEVAIFSVFLYPISAFKLDPAALAGVLFALTLACGRIFQTKDNAH